MQQILTLFSWDYQERKTATNSNNCMKKRHGPERKCWTLIKVDIIYKSMHCWPGDTDHLQCISNSTTSYFRTVKTLINPAISWWFECTIYQDRSITPCICSGQNPYVHSCMGINNHIKLYICHSCINFNVCVLILLKLSTRSEVARVVRN